LRSQRPRRGARGGHRRGGRARDRAHLQGRRGHPESPGGGDRERHARGSGQVRRRAQGGEGGGGRGRLMGQYDVHVFVCTSGDDWPTKANVEDFVKYLRGERVQAGRRGGVRKHEAGGVSQRASMSGCPSASVYSIASTPSSARR